MRFDCYSDLEFFGIVMRQPTFNELVGVKSCKLVDFREAWELYQDNAYIMRVFFHMKNMITLSKFKHAFIDVKVHDLKVGDHSCIPGWHFDGFSFDDPAEYILFVSGKGALTEFPEWSVNLYGLPENVSLKEASEKYNSELSDDPAISIPSCTFARYNSFMPHRAKAATCEEKRLLIRLGLANVKPIGNADFKVATY